MSLYEILLRDFIVGILFVTEHPGNNDTLQLH